VKRTLNPKLVNATPPRDPNFLYDGHWVFLRDAKNIAPFNECSIGLIEIEVMSSSEIHIADIKQQVRETEAALSVHAAIEPTPEPHVILTEDCFGLSGPVTLLIYSEQPFQ
jgi:hypothetical protein